MVAVGLAPDVFRRFARRLGVVSALPRELTRLRLLAIVAPLVFLVVVAYLIRGPFHEELHEFPGFLYVLAVLAGAVGVFSFAIFGLIARLEHRIVEQNRELTALLEVGQAASSSTDLEAMLDRALDAVVGVTSAEAAEVWLLEGDELQLARLRGADLDAFQERTRLRLGEGIPGCAAESRRPVVVHDLPSDPRFVRKRLLRRGFQSFCAFPLLRGGELVGVLGVAARRHAALTSAAEHRLLEGIGERVAVAAENARLHARVLDAAVLEERERIARELHDGLAQVLGYVNAQTLAIKRLLASGRRQEAERQIAEMEATSREVYAEVREAILGLRSTRAGLLASLRKYVADYRSIADAELDLEVAEAVESLRLAPSSEIQLVRIVQEALGNVRKHAHANRVVVRLSVVGGILTVEVEDDGHGFDSARSARTGWPQFGLQIMRERAEAIGGTFEIVPGVERGTRVLVHVPVERAPEEEEEDVHAGAAR